MKSCFFIGHREASEGIFPELAEAVEQRLPRSILCVRPGSHAVTGSILLFILKPD